ncbi:MAG TPA: dephospho-CoA kinase [Puia sp.]|jgi:dephospho-CoA kinase|nr:dephospho-CoA kinase [Puia sp.]
MTSIHRSSAQPILRVGLTGGIGSGKTTIAKIFETLGVPVSYADQEAKLLMNKDPGLRAAIIARFGPEAYIAETGALNRPWMAAQVFSDPVKLEALNSLVHPATIQFGELWMTALAGHAPYAIREAALIFESASAGHLDFIIGVYAPLSVRISRTMQRDHRTREEVLQRMRYQIDEEIKMRLCDAVIQNDGQQAVLPQVLALHQRLLGLAT